MLGFSESWYAMHLCCVPIGIWFLLGLGEEGTRSRYRDPVARGSFICEFADVHLGPGVK